MKTKASTQKEVNLLDLIPERKIEWDKDKAGLIVLLKPKFRHSFFQDHILPILKRPHYKIKLDEIGSFFWECCDGTRSVKDIAERMNTHFGKRVDPLYDRIVAFLQNLEKNKFIRYRGL